MIFPPLFPFIEATTDECDRVCVAPSRRVARTVTPTRDTILQAMRHIQTESSSTVSSYPERPDFKVMLQVTSVASHASTRCSPTENILSNDFITGNEGSLPDTWSGQGFICVRNQKGILCARQKVPPRYQ